MPEKIVKNTGFVTEKHELMSELRKLYKCDQAMDKSVSLSKIYKQTNMKKSLLLLALPLAMVACGGGGVEADAEKACTMAKDIAAAIKDGKTEDATAKAEEMKKFGEEMEAKWKDDKAAKETFEKKMQECQESMK